MAANQLLLIGRDGNGKTSCLRTLSKLQKRKTSIQVSECDGVGDTGEDLVGDIEAVLNNVEGEIQNYTQGYGGIDALGFVLKFGVRYTQQEKNAVQTIKLIFGEDVFKNWGVVIFTYGDLFEKPDGDGRSAFMECCKEQTGEIQKLFKEVDYRCVLFDNKTNDEDKIRQQVNELEVKIDQVVKKKHFQKYGLEKYASAKLGRDELIFREKLTIQRGPDNLDIEKKDKSSNKFSLVSLCSCITWVCFLIATISKHVFFRIKIMLIYFLRLNTAVFNTVYNLLLLLFSCVKDIIKRIINFIRGRPKVKCSEPKCP